jgi:hypothetical protein
LSVFEGEVDLHACIYCHNYSRGKNDVLFSEKFRKILKPFPIYAREDFEKLGSFLKEKIGKGEGLGIFNRFVRSDIRPSKKLIDYAHRMIDGQKTFTLIDEQLTANNTILDRAKKAAKAEKNQ